MRTQTIPAMALLAVSASVAPVAMAQTFVEGVNHEIPRETSWTATRGHEQAFLWTAQSDFDMAQMLWHSSAIADGIIRLRANDGGRPGEILREARFSTTEIGWGGGLFDVPYAVNAGEQYFVTFASVRGDYRDFVAVAHPDAVQMPYFWQPVDSGASWNGPFTGAPGRRPIMFYSAAACYADFDGDGDLTIFDFLEFSNLFDAGDLAADCDGDGGLSIFDFLCFQNAFDAGCE